MAITIEIDLTIESDFASQYDERLIPDRVRRQQGKDFFPSPSIPLGWLLNITFNSFFKDWKQDDVLESTLSCYYMLFGMSPKLLKRWGELDPYAPYVFGAGIMCDCCGDELNILNKGDYICGRCEKRFDKSMEII